MQSVLILAYTSVTAAATWNLLPTVSLPDAENAYVLGPWNEDGTRFMTAADDIYYHTDGAATGTFTTTPSSLMDDIVEYGFTDHIDDNLNNKSNFFVHSFLTYRGDDTCFGIGIDFNDNINVTYHTVFFVLNNIIGQRLSPAYMSNIPPLDYAAAITHTNTDVKVYARTGWGTEGVNTPIPASFIDFTLSETVAGLVSSADGSTIAAIEPTDVIVGDPDDGDPTFSVEESTDHDFKSVALNSDGSRLIAATTNSILVYGRSITRGVGQSTTSFNIEHRYSTIYANNTLDLQQCSFSANEMVIACLATAHGHHLGGNVDLSLYGSNCVAVFTFMSNIDNITIVLSAAMTFPLDLDMYSILDNTNAKLFMPETPIIRTEQVDTPAALEFTDVSVYLKIATEITEKSIIAATYVETGDSPHTKVALMKSSIPVPPPPPPTPSPPSKSSGSSAGMVVGVTFGAVALIGVVGYLIYSTSARRSQSANTLRLYM